jgi:hypothetical protein
MRQIGARQEAGKVGGIGSCGRELCCSTWLNDFKSVNTNAARYQNLSINQTKLSGQCGRLKCCLNYELDTYLDALQAFPENADSLETAKARAVLVKKDIFKNLMWYMLPDSSRQYPLTIARVKEIKELNRQGIKPEDLQAVEIVSGKPKELEPEFVDVVGQISLKTLDKANRKNREKEQRARQQQQGNRPQQQKPQQPQQAGGQKQQNQERQPQQPMQKRPVQAGGGNNPNQRPPQNTQQQRPPQNQNTNRPPQNQRPKQPRPQQPQKPPPPQE